jgi:hypothetical protein
MRARSWFLFGLLAAAACTETGAQDSATDAADARTLIADVPASEMASDDVAAVAVDAEDAPIAGAEIAGVPVGDATAFPGEVEEDVPIADAGATGEAQLAEAGTAGEAGAVEVLPGEAGPATCVPLPFDPPAQGVDGGGGRRYYPPTRWLLGPIYGTGCPDFGPCESGDPTSAEEGGSTMAEEVAYHLDRLAAADIPITLYHFDGTAWSDGNCNWTLGEGLRDRLRTSHIRALLHYWGGCYQAQDFERAYAELGDVLGGFYLDDGAYGSLAKAAIDWGEARMPGDFDLVMKAFRGGDQVGVLDDLAAYGHACYVNDLPTDFDGMRTGIERVFSLAGILPLPFHEFTGYWIGQSDEETFFRRIHWGALQPVMDHSPWWHVSPWESVFSPAVLDDYRYFAWLHYELVPYFHSYDWDAYETGAPVFRQPDALHYTTKIGEEVFAAFVTQAGVEHLEITLPPGTWIDYWDPAKSYAGTITQPVPLGREPIFIKDGAIIPMQVSRAYTGHGGAASDGSLTVLVYPNGRSRFRYRDDAAGRWIAIGAEAAGETLTLGTAEAPSQPLLYRVERWPTAPTAVAICGTTVMVNGPAGSPPAASEDDVNGALGGAWFYDPRARRLVVKAFPEQ